MTSLFGLNKTIKNAELILIPVPWDITTSYHKGTSNGPEAIINASPQLDLYHPLCPNFESLPFYMSPINPDWKALNNTLNKDTQQIISDYDNGLSTDNDRLLMVNTKSQAFFKDLTTTCHTYLQENKTVALVGGEHSITYSAVEALSHYHSNFGILQIDAHMDLRHAYQGFHYSHASVMTNISKLNAISSLTQVGIRDYCQEEQAYATQHNITTFTQRDLTHAQFNGETWAKLCNNIVQTLPDQIYISLDIDGLSPLYCPHTGTPVPGGLSFDQIIFLLETCVNANKHIIGFDCVEVGVDKNREWDANVGARLLFHLIMSTFNSRS